MFIILLYAQGLISQEAKWSLGLSGGFSGVNEVVVNDVEFNNHLKFNKKANTLENKFKNTSCYSGRLNFSRHFINGLLEQASIEASLALYSFSSTYFKEDQFSITLDVNDTITSPNWIVAKYSIPYFEFGINRAINIDRFVKLEVGIFLGYAVELYGTSILTLWDKDYSQYERHNFTFFKENPNDEYEQFNYGIRAFLVLFPEKNIHPFIQVTQSFNDISKENFYLNKHANIWSFHTGIKYNLKTETSENAIED